MAMSSAALQHHRRGAADARRFETPVRRAGRRRTRRARPDGRRGDSSSPPTVQFPASTTVGDSTKPAPAGRISQQAAKGGLPGVPPPASLRDANRGRHLPASTPRPRTSLSSAAIGRLRRRRPPRSSRGPRRAPQWRTHELLPVGGRSRSGRRITADQAALSATGCSGLSRISVAERVLPSWARAARLTCVRTAGDSLEPADGALVVVDKDRRVAVDEQLFVVRIGEALVVKRFRQVGGQWNLVSDSLAHLPRPMTADDRIVGRVAWCGPHRAAVA